MQHAGGALNLSVLSKGLEARFPMCVMSLSHFCWLLSEDDRPEVEHITCKGAVKFLQTQPFFSCHCQKVMVWLPSLKMWPGRAVACNSFFLCYYSSFGGTIHELPLPSSPMFCQENEECELQVKYTWDPRSLIIHLLTYQHQKVIIITPSAFCICGGTGVL